MGGDSGPVQLLSQPIGKVVEPHVPGRPSAPGDRLAVTVGSRADPTVAMAFGLFFFLPSCRLPPPGRASTAVARKSTEMRSIASFIVWTLCLRTGGQGDGASDDQTAHACAGRCVVRVWSVCGKHRARFGVGSVEPATRFACCSSRALRVLRVAALVSKTVVNVSKKQN